MAEIGSRRMALVRRAEKRANVVVLVVITSMLAAWISALG